MTEEAVHKADKMFKSMTYSVLIRTFNSANTLDVTLSSLENQTIAPSQYIFVDSGSVDGTLNMLPRNCTICEIDRDQFSFSKSLNMGLLHVTHPYVLIISSHTSIEVPESIQFALGLMANNKEIGAAYLCNDNDGNLKFELIDKNNFDGFNGLWNTCSLVRMELLRVRGFREDVFSAEDQEWARWLFHCKGKSIARIAGGGYKNNNPRQSSPKKFANEYVSIAYFCNRKLIGPRNLCGIAFNVIRPRGGFRLNNRLLFLQLFIRLVSCYFVKPSSESRYY